VSISARSESNLWPSTWAWESMYMADVYVIASAGLFSSVSGGVDTTQGRSPKAFRPQTWDVVAGGARCADPFWLDSALSREQEVCLTDHFDLSNPEPRRKTIPAVTRKLCWVELEDGIPAKIAISLGIPWRVSR